MAAWDAGDTCGAAAKADELKDATEQAIAAGDVPAAYQDDLESAVENLQNTANCTDEGEDDEGHGPGEAKGHDKPPKHDKHDLPPPVSTDTTGTTTDENDQ